MSDILEPDMNDPDHKIYVNVLSVSCHCGWTAEVTDPKYAEAVGDRHLILEGVIDLEEDDE